MLELSENLFYLPPLQVQDNFVRILLELITGLGDGQWRVRESCCDAVSEVISGGNYVLLLRHLPLTEQQQAAQLAKTAAPESPAKALKSEEDDTTAIKQGPVVATPEKQPSPPAMAAVSGSTASSGSSCSVFL
jgi:hypothetical protein